jgi:beta-galactosidase
MSQPISRITRYRSILALFACLGLSACAQNRTMEPQVLATAGTETALSPRVSSNLDAGWKFIRSDQTGAERPEFDDSSWDSVNLPHTWNALDGEDGGSDYYRGPAWYRRHISAADLQVMGGRSVYLKFGAASSVASVYVNGKLAGDPHKGMFAAFCYDITPLLNFNGDNVVAVRVTNAPDDTVPPLSADFTFFGGLYRDVQLLGLSPMSISATDDASPGVYVKQTGATEDHADLQVTSRLHNGSTSPQNVDVLCDLFDPSGKAVQSGTLRTIVSQNSDTDVTQTLAIDHPHLWNGRKDAFLYHLRVQISIGDSVVDAVLQPVGIRYFNVDPDKGFFLNGKSYPLHGVNRHQDRIDMGWAITQTQQQEDYDLMAEMGCNALRLAHYQHAQNFYDLCDRGGMIVWAEACLVNEVHDSPDFDAVVMQQLRELIKQSYNHPSICFWSLFNELPDPKSVKKMTPVKEDEMRHELTLVMGLNQLAHDLDPGRLTTGATNTTQIDYALNFITDVIAFNRYYGWYERTPEYWNSGVDDIHQKLSGRSLGISEYGAGASVSQHDLNPHQPKTNGFYHPEEWQNVVHEAAYNAMKQRPYLWGTFLWNMFDFAADNRAEGDHLGRNDKGLVTYDRKTKKDAFYFYKANWSDQPVIYITSRHYTPRNVKEGPVKVYSNCDSVELKLNGKSLGILTKPDHVFVWPDVILARGVNQLEADGSFNGQGISDTCEINYDPGVLDLQATRPSTRP